MKIAHLIFGPQLLGNEGLDSVRLPRAARGRCRLFPRSREAVGPNSARLFRLPEAERRSGNGCRCTAAAERRRAEGDPGLAPASGCSTMDEAGSCTSGGGFRPGVDSLDEPPNSRIFLVISKYTPESVLRERFSPFGEIQDIWVVRDKHTKESKGIAFVKFARSSQACRAMEEMHGRCLGPNDTKPIKVRVPGSGTLGDSVWGWG